MAAKNSQKHLSVGIGIYTPWRRVDHRVKQSLTAQAPKRRNEWKIGYWKYGRLVESKPKTTDNRRIRPRGSAAPVNVQSLNFDPKKGWGRIPF